MISDEDVKQLYMNGQKMLLEFPQSTKFLPTQFHRGVGLHAWKNQHPAGCARHMSIFDRYKVIPKYCFSCYKVLFEPRTVVELFKLMVIFDSMVLPKDNTRKCIIETRNQISGAYKGYIYCRGIDEGKDVLKISEKIVSEKISEEIPVTLRRGCSEYAVAYPEYADISQAEDLWEYKEEWQEYEELADKYYGKRELGLSADVTHNQPGYTPHEAMVMRTWLGYAAAIGDISYMKISGLVLPPLENLKRTSLFPQSEGE